MSAFSDLGAIAPQQIWDRIAARSLHGERITLSVVELDGDQTADGRPGHDE